MKRSVKVEEQLLFAVRMAVVTDTEAKVLYILNGELKQKNMIKCTKIKDDGFDTKRRKNSKNFFGQQKKYYKWRTLNISLEKATRWKNQEQSNENYDINTYTLK